MGTASHAHAVIVLRDRRRGGEIYSSPRRFSFDVSDTTGSGVRS